jgi:transcriptional regulator with XRE-family HTH domain
MKAEFPGITAHAVGRRLRITRDALGLSQTEFGRRAGISKSAMNNIEHGRNFPTIPNVVALSEAHELTLQWICTGSMKGLRHELAEAIIALANARTERAPPTPPRAA